MFPMWLYFMVAAVIALAFGVGQVVPGLGPMFVAAATALWVAYSVHRQSRFR